MLNMLPLKLTLQLQIDRCLIFEPDFFDFYLLLIEKNYQNHKITNLSSFSNLSMCKTCQRIKFLNIKSVPTFLFFKNGQLSSALVDHDLTKDELWHRTAKLLEV